MKHTLYALTFLALVSCGNGSGQPEPSASPPAAVTSGEVIETMDVDSYTYVKLDIGGQQTWIATSPMTVQEGDTVTFTGGMLMKGFYSSTLDRTFDEIVFVSKAEVAGSPAISDAGSHGGATMGADPHAGLDIMPTGETQPVDDRPPVATLTIAELLADTGKYAGQRVTLQGRVIKFNEQIMNKNWITLVDGSETDPGNQLTVTTNLTVNVGDELTLDGTVRIDVDLGHGYEYEVLVEDAVFQ
jgi:hypothetical protein